MRILIVDDSKAMRMIVKRHVGQAMPDAELVEAENGAQALDMVRADTPDLVLCDWNMPEMTGIQFLRALREEGRDVPFGFVTSETQPQMREQAIAAGAMFCLAKPFTAEAFQDILASIS
jgi:two-component system chemotaxis response regulator CheY